MLSLAEQKETGRKEARNQKHPGPRLSKGNQVIKELGTRGIPGPRLSKGNQVVKELGTRGPWCETEQKETDRKGAWNRAEGAESAGKWYITTCGWPEKGVPHEGAVSITPLEWVERKDER